MISQAAILALAWNAAGCGKQGVYAALSHAKDAVAAEVALIRAKLIEGGDLEDDSWLRTDEVELDSGTFLPRRSSYRRATLTATISLPPRLSYRCALHTAAVLILIPSLCVVADDAISAMVHEMLMVRHPNSKPPDLSKQAKYRRERGLVAKLRKKGGWWGSGKKYWNSGSSTARRDFATDALKYVKAEGFPNARWPEVFFPKAHDPNNHVLEDEEYEDPGPGYQPHPPAGVGGGGTASADDGGGNDSAAFDDHDGGGIDSAAFDDHDGSGTNSAAFDDHDGGGTDSAEGGAMADAMEVDDAPFEDYDPFEGLREDNFVLGNGRVLGPDGQVSWDFECQDFECQFCGYSCSPGPESQRCPECKTWVI